MMPTRILMLRKGIIADTILLPGDPLRAKFIADNYLENVVQFNSVRNMFGYTGYYNGKNFSNGNGNGNTINWYIFPWINPFYDVKNLIRIGSAGSIQPDVNVYDIVFGMAASTNSNYASQYGLNGTYARMLPGNCLKATDIATQKALILRLAIFFRPILSIMMM